MRAHRLAGLLLLVVCGQLALSPDPATAQGSRGQSQTLPLPTNPAATTPAKPPTPALAPPITPLSPPASLSPQITTTPLSGGIATRVPSASPSSTSPSEASPSAPGGGGRTLADCVRFWDPATHMTKSEWKAACQRSLTRLDTLKVDDMGTAPAKKSR
jgi:hypothetical protein